MVPRSSLTVSNLLNLEKVTKSFGRRPLLDGVSLGLAAGERVGVVGRNGGGKSTLIKVIAGLEPVDSGRVTRAGGLRLGVLDQAGSIAASTTIRQYVMGDAHTHAWAAVGAIRDVLTHLLGGFDDVLLDRTMDRLSGGERRRVELAHLLTSELDVLLLDEPTNHLDVEAIAWLAGHLRARRELALVVVTHDRWFLDEVSDRTWEVVDGRVEEYEGGYSAFVLAKAERSRQAGVEQQRRNNLIRKELAWLRRGAPARTAKPKFRIAAATQLISAEPPPRNQVELLSFAGARLGKTVFELHDASITLGQRRLLDRVDWNVGPGDRIGVVGVNGVGKTTLLNVLLGLARVDSDQLVTGVTVKPAYLSQHLEELNPRLRVLEAVADIAERVELSKGRELTASQLCERLGFGSDAQWTPVADLSGGERRRLQLTRLLMGGPNVLILDEPTNDFDVETLAALEDLLDSFPGTIICVSHDRYFLERVCDTFVGLFGDGKIRDLPGGIDEYLRLRRHARDVGPALQRAGATAPAARISSQQRLDERAARKELARLERTIAKADAQERELHELIATHSSDYAKLAELTAALDEVVAARQEAEAAWLDLVDEADDEQGD